MHWMACVCFVVLECVAESNFITTHFFSFLAIPDIKFPLCLSSLTFPTGVGEFVLSLTSGLRFRVWRLTPGPVAPCEAVVVI